MKWHPWFHALIRRLYFSRVKVLGLSHLPAEGPVLALCLHRNGAVDAFLYRKALPQVRFMVKAGLRSSPMGRLFFDGVEVTRQEDGGKHDNFEAIRECQEVLAEGGWLGVFPEGTSELGPRHLPFKSGAARIALGHHESGGTLTILPLGIHYECAWAFRSRAEIVIGRPVSLDGLAEISSRPARLVEVKRRFTAALEAVGANFPSDAAQGLAEKFAYIATLGTGHGYYDSLKVMERQLPPVAASAWADWESRSSGRRVWYHQGVPLFPLRMPWAYALAALLLAPLVLAGALANAPPLVLAWWAGRTFPDDTNVIALWRILTGVPLLILWTAACCVTAVALGLWWLPLLYLALTWLAVNGWYRWKKLAVVAWNGWFHADLRPAALIVRQEVLSAIATPSHDSPTAATSAAA